MKPKNATPSLGIPAAKLEERGRTNANRPLVASTGVASAKASLDKSLSLLG